MKHTLLTIFLAINSLILFPQVILTIEGTEINNTITGRFEGVVIPRDVPTILTYRNNSITSVNEEGYMLQAGDETPGETNNNLDGEVITGNRLTWNGTSEESWTHVMFTGYNVDAVIEYNYFYRPPNCIQRKSNGMTDTKGVVAYNIINNPKVGVVVKGMNGVRIYNNTFYSDKTMTQTPRALIDIHTNTDGGLNAASKGTKVFNNIFYTRNKVLNIWVYEEACLEGFESDYNVFWCESGEPVFKVEDKYKSFTQWQAMGYDLHSVVINPDFVDFIDFVPQSRLDYGKDMGTDFKDGLAVDAVWGKTDPRTVSQNGKWQVGARIFEEVVDSEEPEDPEPVLRIYPNPVIGSLYIEMTDPQRIYQIMKIYDSKGRIIMTRAIEFGKNEIPIPSDFSTGLYSIVLEAEALDHYKRKFIIIN